MIRHLSFQGGIGTIFAAFTILASNAADTSSEGFDKDACAFDGFPLYGNVQIVDSFPDVKVQVVESFADLHVEIVTSFPDKCGQWMLVDTFPDVKIQYVESFPDLKIKMVTSFPGIQ